MGASRTRADPAARCRTRHVGADRHAARHPTAAHGVDEHADDWLRDHADVSDPAERERVEFVDHIRAVASVRWAMAEAERIYLADGLAARTAFNDDKTTSACLNMQALGESSGFDAKNYAERGAGSIGQRLADAHRQPGDEPDRRHHADQGREPPQDLPAVGQSRRDGDPAAG